MFSYKCPDCKSKLNVETEAKPGQKFRCSECQGSFIPRAEVMTFAADDDPKPAKAKAKAKAAPPAPAPSKAKAKAAPKPEPQPEPPPAPAPVSDEEEIGSYGIIKESEEELKIAEKNKPVFGNVRDKFKRSARGPASSLLVLPSNLLIGQGALTAVFGLLMVIVGAWPLVFTDVPTSDEEYAEQMSYIFMGIVAMCWGGIQCFGASQMQNLESYPWGIVAAVFGFLPLLAGIFALITLNDPRVIAGFEEPEGGPNQAEEEEKPDDDDDEDDEDDDEDDEDDEDDDDDDEEEEERPRKKRR